MPDEAQLVRRSGLFEWTDQWPVGRSRLERVFGRRSALFSGVEGDQMLEERRKMTLVSLWLVATAILNGKTEVLAKENLTGSGRLC